MFKTTLNSYTGRDLPWGYIHTCNMGHMLLTVIAPVIPRNVHETSKGLSLKVNPNPRETTQYLFKHTYQCKTLRATRAPSLENQDSCTSVNSIYIYDSMCVLWVWPISPISWQQSGIINVRECLHMDNYIQWDTKFIGEYPIFVHVHSIDI